MGRPSKFTPALAAEICERLSKGEPLAVICRDDHMPSDTTVRNWMGEDQQLSSDIARAREVGFDQIAADCLMIADDSSGDAGEPDEVQEEQGHGGSLRRLKPGGAENVQRAKLRIETRLKLLAKWDPKRYGDKVALTGGGEGDAPIRSELKLTFV